MPDVGYIAAALGVFLVVTFALRAAPFLVVERLRESRAVAWLGARMPVGIMVILVIYTLRDPGGTTAPRGLVEAVALAVTVGLHLWRRNALLSIVGGTAVYATLLPPGVIGLATAAWRFFTFYAPVGLAALLFPLLGRRSAA